MQFAESDGATTSSFKEKKTEKRNLHLPTDTWNLRFEMYPLWNLFSYMIISGIQKRNPNPIPIQKISMWLENQCTNEHVALFTLLSFII